MAESILLVVRGAVALSSGAAGVVALTHWLVRQGTITPFGWWPRTIRQLAEPAMRPMERQVVRRGGNPQHAPYWLLAALVLGGLVLISLTETLIGVALQIRGASEGGVKGMVRLVIVAAYNAMSFALLVRALGSWFGYGEWTPWMRPFHLATNWMLRPLQRVLPPVGMMDISPLVALLIISLVVRPLVAVLFR